MKPTENRVPAEVFIMRPARPGVLGMLQRQRQERETRRKQYESIFASVGTVASALILVICLPSGLPMTGTRVGGALVGILGAAVGGFTLGWTMRGRKAP